MIEPQFVEVVTRYGGRRHLALAQGQLAAAGDAGRQRTLCMGTSSWTIASWAGEPDHPLGLTAEQMQRLPLCEGCQVQKRYLTPLPQDLRVPVKDDEPTVTMEEVARADLAVLDRVPCQFAVCPGPNEPMVAMATCFVCARIIELRDLLGIGSDSEPEADR